MERRGDADWQGAIGAFEKYQTTFHLDANAAKNASLYVDYEKGQFSTPKDRITETMVASISRLNSEFLSLMYPEVDMLLRWQRNPDEVEPMMNWLATRLEELKSQLPKDPEEAVATLMREMVERKRGK